MLSLTNRYVKALIEYAEECGQDKIYRQALKMMVNKGKPKDEEDEICHFFNQLQVGDNERLKVLRMFSEQMAKRMNLANAEIISAVPLSEPQIKVIEERLERIFKKQLDVTATVDPSLLGGVRAIVDNTVLDDSIKRKLRDMKREILAKQDIFE